MQIDTFIYGPLTVTLGRKDASLVYAGRDSDQSKRISLYEAEKVLYDAPRSQANTAELERLFYRAEEIE